MSQIDIDLKRMLAAGLHFGHFQRRWHPSIAPYLHGVRGGRCVIDLTLTKRALEEILPVITQVVAEGRTILLVGTKRQAQEIVKQAAESVQMPYVTYRWVGGMLTNYTTISVQIKRLKELERRMASGELVNKYNKLEVQNFQKRIDALNLLYGGIKDMGLRPGLVFVTDMQVNAIAVTEARKLDIPLVAIADTNVDPTLATYPIPANDDALQSLQFIVDLVVQAIKIGQKQIKHEPAPTAVATAVRRPTADGQSKPSSAPAAVRRPAADNSSKPPGVKN